MRLSDTDAWSRLATADHGVLATLHPERGADLVPVVFAVVDRLVAIPIDAVKPKFTTRLQRLANLERDPRCALLVEHYASDWGELWWVRVHGRGVEVTARQLETYRDPLAERYPAYAKPGAITGGIVITPDGITGWSAA